MDSTLRALVDLRDRTIQKSRIAFGNRVSALERGADTSGNGTMELITRWEERFDMLEAEADKDIERLAAKEPIIEQMIKVRGVGLLLAAKVAAMIDIEKSPTISSLWRYAGYGLKDGERDKPTKGEKLIYNKRLKTTCYLVGTSFLRSNSPYRHIYDEARIYYDGSHPDWTKAHKHNAAIRKMIKIWLSHLWLVWREMEELPTSDPYIIASDPSHTHLITPNEMGWDKAMNEE